MSIVFSVRFGDYERRKRACKKLFPCSRKHTINLKKIRPFRGQWDTGIPTRGLDDAKWPHSATSSPHYTDRREGERELPNTTTYVPGRKGHEPHSLQNKSNNKIQSSSPPPLSKFWGGKKRSSSSSSSPRKDQVLRRRRRQERASSKDFNEKSNGLHKRERENKKKANTSEERIEALRNV